MTALAAVFFAGLLLYGLVSRLLDARGVTPQIVLLGLGVLFGLVTLGDPAYALDIEVVHVAGEVALVLCLFVDAARIDIGRLRGSAALPTRLLAIGLPLTIVAGTVAAVAILPGVDLAAARLIALLVAPTDAALGAVVVTSRAIPLRIRQALNVESGLNDGLVTPLVLVAVAIVLTETRTGPTDWLADAALQIGAGTLAGVVAGAGAALLLRIAVARNLVLPGARWVAAPSIALLAWALAVALGGNPFVAAFVAGIASTATFGRVPDAFLEFGEIVGELLALIVFFAFGIVAASLGPYDVPVIAFAVLALTAVRMLPVAVALIGTGLAPATIGFVGWFGPRGLASIVLAIVAIEELRTDAVLDERILAAVALTVLLSVLAHGLTAGPGVRAYHRFAAHLPATAPELGSTIDLPGRGRIMHGPTAADRPTGVDAA
jgi:NhaP-type Na+/H+ or K+/H+ antiporter